MRDGLEDARHAFIGEATRLLVSSLDPEQAVATVATLAVPHMVSWAAGQTTIEVRLPRSPALRAAE